MGFEPKRDEVRRMIAESDRDGSGTISFDTFQAVMTSKMHARDPKDEAIKAFRLFDDDETGARAGRAHPAEVRSGSTRSAFEAKAPAFNVTLFRQRGRDTPGTPSSSASRGGTRPWTTGSGYGRSGAANEALSVTNIARVPDATGRFKPLDSLYRSRLHDLPIQLGVG